MADVALIGSGFNQDRTPQNVLLYIIIWSKMKNLLWQDRFDLANEARCVNQEKLENLKLSLLEESEGTNYIEVITIALFSEVTNRCNLRCALCPTQYDDSDMPRIY